MVGDVIWDEHQFEASLVRFNYRSDVFMVNIRHNVSIKVFWGCWLCGSMVQ